MNNQEIINFYIDNEILIGPDILKELSVKALPLRSNFSVLNKDTLFLSEQKKTVLVEDFEKAIVLKEKHKNTKLYERFIDYLKDPETNLKNRESILSNLEKSSLEKSSLSVNLSSTINVVSNINNINIINNSDVIHLNKTTASEISTDLKEIKAVKSELKDILNEEQELFLKKHKIKLTSNYISKSKKWSVHDFVSLYNARFKELEKILRARQELQSLTSISRISAKKERENVALIGVVYDKGLTKTGNIMLTIEDPTGMVKAVVTKVKEDLFKFADEIQLDEVIGITGMFDQIIFVNNLFIPDIPLSKELRKSPDEGYFVIISDTQLGSKLFLDKEFDKFLSWINGEIGTDKQKEVASNVKYLFIGGDLVDGVGIYPNQEFDLNIIDQKDQYNALAELLKRVPEYIPIIICPGNHDVGRISEPQPPLSRGYTDKLLDLPNIVSVSNPSMINIYAQPDKGFEGFDVLFYHGLSFVYYSEHIPSIRRLGGQKRPDLIMKYLLQRRHLAPSHTSTLYIPDPKRDPLVIDKIPDFFVSGHVHRAMVSNYKNVTCFNASCWVSQSDEQERRGLEAQPARAFIVDMHTREVKIMNFLSKEDQEKESPEKTSSEKTVAEKPPVSEKSLEVNSPQDISKEQPKDVTKDITKEITKEVTNG